MADNNAADTTEDGKWKQIHFVNGIRSPWVPTKTKGKLTQGTHLRVCL